MSDGNYNRNLLPYRQYESGLKAGKAQMHTRALKALETMLQEKQFYEAETAAWLTRFRELLPRG